VRASGPAVSHETDFDFLHGEWRVAHRRLRRRLAGCQEWDRLDGTMRCWPILGGIGNIDEFVLPALNVRGATLRLFDLADRRWALHWSSTVTGRLDPPLYGTFRDGVGEFHGEDVFDGVPIRVRFLWDEISDGHCRWQQAFSHDGGATWETNWVMELDRVSASD
jgi:hypothetical protein